MRACEGGATLLGTINHHLAVRFWDWMFRNHAYVFFLPSFATSFCLELVLCFLTWKKELYSHAFVHGWNYLNSMCSFVCCETSHLSADYEAVVKLSEDFNGADLRNVCTEAGVFVNVSCVLSWQLLAALFLSRFVLSLRDVCYQMWSGVCYERRFHEGCAKSGGQQEVGG